MITDRLEKLASKQSRIWESTNESILHLRTGLLEGTCQEVQTLPRGPFLGKLPAGNDNGTQRRADLAQILVTMKRLTVSTHERVK